MPSPGWDKVSYYQNTDMGRFVILLIIVSGIVAVRDLSNVIDGCIHIASPGFRALKDCTRFRRMYGWLGMIFHGICLQRTAGRVRRDGVKCWLHSIYYGRGG